MSKAELGSSRTDRCIGSRTGDPGGARVMLRKGQEAKYGRSAREEHLEHESRKHIWKVQVCASRETAC